MIGPRYLMFPPRLRVADVVTRWSLTYTTVANDVAQHSFYVTFYARQIAVLIDWEGDWAGLMFRALTDDLGETITGDICSPVKNEIVDNQRSSDYIKRRMEDDLPYVLRELEDERAGQNDQEAEEITRIIKAADTFDALLFLQREELRGNHTVQLDLKKAWNRFEASWYDLPAERAALERLWENTMVPAVNEHRKSIQYW